MKPIFILLLLTLYLPVTGCKDTDSLQSIQHELHLKLEGFTKINETTDCYETDCTTTIVYKISGKQKDEFIHELNRRRVPNNGIGYWQKKGQDWHYEPIPKILHSGNNLIMKYSPAKGILIVELVQI